MKWLNLLVSFLLFASCEIHPKPIQYGMDACSFCQMTIVDRQHAAQIVTIKGKSYKYDAIECMLRDYKTWDRPEAAHFLVSDYAKPGVLTDASKASFLVSERIPSPMGAYLTAFSSEGSRASHIHDDAELLDWQNLRNKFQIKNQ